MKLFLKPSATALARAQAISTEAARHNIHDIGNLNNPLLAMSFLQRQVRRERFRFVVGGRERKLGSAIRRSASRRRTNPRFSAAAATSTSRRMASTGQTKGPDAL